MSIRCTAIPQFFVLNIIELYYLPLAIDLLMSVMLDAVLTMDRTNLYIQLSEVYI